VVICLERGADLHMAQLIPLPLAVSCFSKIQIDFTFVVPAHPGSPGKRAVKRVCVCVCVSIRVVSAPDCNVRGPRFESHCVWLYFFVTAAAIYSLRCDWLGRNKLI